MRHAGLMIFGVVVAFGLFTIMMSAGEMQNSNVTNKAGFLQQELLSRLPSETELWGTLQNTMHALPKLTMPQDFDKSLASYADSALIAVKAAQQALPNITMPQDFDKNFASYAESALTAVTAVREGLPNITLPSDVEKSIASYAESALTTVTAAQHAFRNANLTMPQDLDKTIALYAESAMTAVTAAKQALPNMTMPQDFDKHIASYAASAMTAVTTASSVAQLALEQSRRPTPSAPPSMVGPEMEVERMWKTLQAPRPPAPLAPINAATSAPVDSILLHESPVPPQTSPTTAAATASATKV